MIWKSVHRGGQEVHRPRVEVKEIYNLRSVEALSLVKSVNGLVKAQPVPNTERLQLPQNTIKVLIALDENLKNVYYDEDGNLQFDNELLEEVIEKPQIDTTTVSKSSRARLLEQIIKNSQEKTDQINITKIAEDLVIEKFTGKAINAEQWISSVEKECERFHIDRSDKKIEVLRLCMENSATDWFSCTLLKLTADAEWTQWRDSFCNTFISKGWSSIKYAMQYKNISGSLLEYSITKKNCYFR
ncbi:hypothetical protein HHI36_004893 [Cryptolaemus montrouzieri]|uniref:Uncharacterized protein n=1 Tax=Cryptolaemus montrouzieri TaxID=559131 RepID=A0ABD2NT36_9CUCU